jgi:hypothetical protein
LLWPVSAVAGNPLLLGLILIGIFGTSPMLIMGRAG